MLPVVLFIIFIVINTIIIITTFIIITISHYWVACVW